MGLVQKFLKLMRLKNLTGGIFGAKLVVGAKEIEVPLDELFRTKSLHEVY